MKRSLTSGRSFDVTRLLAEGWGGIPAQLGLLRATSLAVFVVTLAARYGEGGGVLVTLAHTRH